MAEHHSEDSQAPLLRCCGLKCLEQMRHNHLHSYEHAVHCFVTHHTWCQKQVHMAAQPGSWVTHGLASDVP